MWPVPEKVYARNLAQIVVASAKCGGEEGQASWGCSHCLATILYRSDDIACADVSAPAGWGGCTWRPPPLVAPWR